MALVRAQLWMVCGTLGWCVRLTGPVFPAHSESLHIPSLAVRCLIPSRHGGGEVLGDQLPTCKPCTPGPRYCPAPLSGTEVGLRVSLFWRSRKPETLSSTGGGCGPRVLCQEDSSWGDPANWGQVKSLEALRCSFRSQTSRGFSQPLPTPIEINTSKSCQMF